MIILKHFFRKGGLCLCLGFCNAILGCSVQNSLPPAHDYHTATLYFILRPGDTRENIPAVLASIACKGIIVRSLETVVVSGRLLKMVLMIDVGDEDQLVRLRSVLQASGARIHSFAFSADE